MIVVSDTSPITNLTAIGQLLLLKHLYGTVVLPEAVYTELTRPPISTGGAEAKKYDWIRVRSVSSRSLEKLAKYKLDAGETEAIALAFELEGSKLLIDERLGRNAAEELGLKFTGVLGILLQAKGQGLVTEIQPLLDELRESVGFYIAEPLYSQVLKAAQEF